MSVAQEIILSICIPTYRRGAYLARDVMGWLASDRQDFEIIISDNASGDGSFEILNRIKDPRVRVIENKANIGGFENGFKTFLAARGKYAMILMDKDGLNFQHIDDVLDTMDQLDVACGRVEPDSRPSSVTKLSITKAHSHILFKYGLIYAHPSGHFYKTKLFLTSDIVQTLRELPKEIRPFCTDFQISLFSQYGTYARIKIPFIVLNHPPYQGIKQSITYTDPNKAFFTPQAHFAAMEIFIRLLRKINRNAFWKFLIIIKQTGLLFAFSTSTYFYTLSKKSIIDWYGINQEYKEQELKRPLVHDFYKRMFSLRTETSAEHSAVILGCILCIPFALRYWIWRYCTKLHH